VSRAGGHRHSEASPANYYTKRFYEVAPHWTEIGWVYLVSPLVMSEPFYAALAPWDQEAVRAAAARAVSWEREEYQRQERESTARLEAAGIRRVWEASRGRVHVYQVEAIVHTR